MRVGTVLPQMGTVAGPAAIQRAAREAEALSYDSLWVAERLLFPLRPQNPYPGSPDGSLPAIYRHVLTPLETLTYAAAHTSRIALGTSILNMPYHQPVMLARQLATLDVLSGGRLHVGLGQGWSQDELQAVGAATADRAARADEFIAVLKAMWTAEPVEHRGRYFQVPASIVEPKPVQRPHPPIYLAAYAPAALARAARLADGWLPTGIPLAALRQLVPSFRAMAAANGRAPGATAVVLLAHVVVTDRIDAPARPDFVGSLDQIAADVTQARALGVDELILSPGASPSAQTEAGFLDTLARLRDLA